MCKWPFSKPRLVPPGHLGSLHFFSGPTPYITKSLLKSRVANLQPTKMSQYRLGNPDAHVPPSLNKGARPQKHVIVSSYLESGGPNVISSFYMFLYQILRLVHPCILTGDLVKKRALQNSNPSKRVPPHALQNGSKERKIAPSLQNTKLLSSSNPHQLTHYLKCILTFHLTFCLAFPVASYFDTY